MKNLLIVTIVGLLTPLAFAQSTDTKNTLSCKWTALTFSVTPSASGYDVGLEDADMAASFGVEALRKQFPNMDDKLIEAMAKEAKQLNFGGGDLGKCAKMSDCVFSPAGSATLVSCTRKIDAQNSVSLSVVLEDPSYYKIKCTETGDMEVTVLNLKIPGKGTRTSILQAEIPPQSCVYQ